jgi:hypothetical protein
MEVNDIVDERYDLEKSTQGACSYLLRQRKIWNLTLAASYNGGMGGKQANGYPERIQLL